MVLVRKMEKISGHPWVRAVAEVDWYGIRLRGIRLEQHADGWRISPPGRRIQGMWQSLFSIQDRRLEQQLLESLRLRHG
ncbi:MAG: hypothetical protein KF760_09635 [Candidatus Eremiobacteraeota bacterium]|nr:hypothetical protein [Candidatus Eremiobacteraeota bacterium]MCW5866291.1 hypothetical protein [Candidatus Eremiobacteraeota bacterium]